MKKRVVITGLGAVTPIGNTVDAFWDGIKKRTDWDWRDYKL